MDSRRSRATEAVAAEADTKDVVGMRDVVAEEGVVVEEADMNIEVAMKVVVHTRDVAVVVAEEEAASEAAVKVKLNRQPHKWLTTSATNFTERSILRIERKAWTNHVRVA